MKKFFAAVFAVAAVCVFGASADEEVKQLFNDYHQALFALEAGKIIPMLSPEFVEIAANGKKMTYREVVKATEAVDAMQRALRPEATLLEIAETMAAAGGPAVTPEMREQFKQMSSTEEGKQQAAQVKILLNATLGQLKNKMNDAWASRKIVSCKYNGKNAKLVFEMKSVENGKMEKTTWDLVKNGGRWLIKKSVSKYRDL